MWRLTKPAYILLKYFNGNERTCKIHELYCTGSNKQFTTFQACMDFQNALPLYSSKCGTGGILSGNSTMCRWKHASMIPLNSMHCFHIGRGLTPDPLGHFKCNDELDCVPPKMGKIPFPIEWLEPSKEIINSGFQYTMPKVCV